MSDEGFDFGDLDWSRHLRGPRHAVVGDGLFLADFARALGCATFQAWDDDEAEALVPWPHGAARLVGPDIAFDGDEPVASVHEAFGPAVRKVLGPAAWRERILRREDQRAWLRSHVPDPDGGPPLPALALASRLGDDAGEPITPENWRSAWLTLEVARFERRIALHHMGLLANGIGELVRDCRIVLIAHPIGGGTPTDVPTGLWTGDHARRMRRLASCGFDAVHPDDAEAEPTHLLFVADDGREEAIEQWSGANFVPIAWPHVAAADPLDELRMDVTLEIGPDGALIDDDLVMPERERTSRNPNLERDVEEFLALGLETYASEGWRGPDLRRLVAFGFGKNMQGITDTARRSLAKQSRFSSLASGGQPKKGARLTEMTDASVKRMADELRAKLATRAGR